MRIRLPLAFLIVAALAMPAAASAKGPAAVHLKSCTTGDKPSERQATFKSWMHSVTGSARMAVRFKLVAQTTGRSAERVDSPQELNTWHRSHTGVTRYVYSQTIKRLEKGTTYRMVVKYRWYDANGEVIKRAKRTSHECEQTGDLPNLIVAGVSYDPSDVGTWHYGVTVKNKGKSLAENFVVTLIVDGAVVDERTVELLEAGESTTVELNGPPCVHLRAIADYDHTVTEKHEDDNSFSSTCP
ncbi:MAG: CARDB domain-containing protein [Thermoleophilaceae bacterium]